jgi:hypothetical protein
MRHSGLSIDKGSRFENMCLGAQGSLMRALVIVEATAAIAQLESCRYTKAKLSHPSLSTPGGLCSNLTVL